MHRAYLTRNTDRVRVTGTPSPGSVAPASFINTVDRVNPSTWSHFPVNAITYKTCLHNYGITIKKVSPHLTLIVVHVT